MSSPIPGPLQPNFFEYYTCSEVQHGLHDSWVQVEVASPLELSGHSKEILDTYPESLGQATSMALDVERNWTVSMAESRRHVQSMSKTKGNRRTNFDLSSVQSIPSTEFTLDTPIVPVKPLNKNVVHLPTEIIINILSFIPRTPQSQPLLHSCCLVSRQWYSAAIRLLYESPRISGKNFKLFVATVCPSINAHIRKSELAELVRRLDMGNLVHDGSKALTARLLGRMKRGLEEFIAPQASFAINCFAALSKCSHLRHLDLSLISESIALSDLFHTIKSLSRLKSLRFPRSSNYDRGFTASNCTWPPTLEFLHLAGGISNKFLCDIENISPSFTSLTMDHCTFASPSSTISLLCNLSNQVTHLKITYNMPSLTPESLDNLLLYCPHLLNLSVAIDFISPHFFDEDSIAQPFPHPLSALELDCTGNAGLERTIDPEDIFLAISDDGPLASLRRVRVSKRLGWQNDPEMKDHMEDLASLLDAKEDEDCERSGVGDMLGRRQDMGKAALPLALRALYTDVTPQAG
ncbi:MAG: hypothetical protein M1827_007282 [Pycnora praestabilis]|nr:MAG: hypothetical protein M1827_007282 [Pycnora praestabilis]